MSTYQRGALSTTEIKSMADLDRVMTHEWGHAIGLAHSNIESAVMAGPPMTYYNALVTLQPDDTRGCRLWFRRFGMYLRMVRGNTRRPSLSTSSLAIRSSPHDGFSEAM